MKITYEKDIDVAYIHLTENKGKVPNTYPCDTTQTGGAQIQLDFDENYVLRGIEVLDASKHLPPELLSSAEVIKSE